VHAIELNGYRSWEENRAVIAIAEVPSMPLISGGDRHGRAPNALLNLTPATSFGEFAREIRRDGRSIVVILPEYRQSLLERKLASAFDALREYPRSAPNQRRWMDRVSYERDGLVRSLSVHWPQGGPLWVRAAMGAFRLGASAPLLPFLRIAVQVTRALTPSPTSPAALVECSWLPNATGPEIHS
jgi:hypothetical protein